MSECDLDKSQKRKPKEFGRGLLKSSGWEEGEGIGLHKKGITTHLKVSRKEDVLGIGYKKNVEQSWSLQSFEFSEVLSRLAKSSEESSVYAERVEPQVPSGGKGSGLYSKRRALKTEGLYDEEGRREVLGPSLSLHQKTVTKLTNGEDNAEEKYQEENPTLHSLILRRLFVRIPKYEHNELNEETSVVSVRKPEIRPPKCTDSPFYA